MIYFYCALFLSLLFIIEKRQGIRNINFFYIGCFIVLFVLGFRSKYVGGDTIEYVNFYNDHFSSYGTHDNNNIEFGYVLYIKIVSLLNNEFLFIFISSFITILPYFLLVKKYGSSYTLPFAYSFLFISFNVCLQTNLRQDFAVGLFLFAYYLIISNHEKKIYIYALPFAIWGLISHNTMFLVIPLFILIHFVKFNKIVSIIIILSSFVVNVITTEYFSDLFTYFNLLFSQTDLLDHYASYGNNGFYELSGETTALNFFNLSLTLWPLLNIYYSNEEEQNSIFLKSMVVSCVVYNICSSFPIAFRMIYLFQYLSLCYVPKRIITDRWGSLLNIILIISWLRVMINTALNTSVQNQDAHMFPYTFIFE